MPPLQVGFDVDGTGQDKVTNAQNVRVTASPTDASGRPAQLDGPLRVTVQGGNGTFAPGNTNNDALLVSEDAPGDTSYLIEGDADLGAGVELIQDTVTVRISGTKAQALGLVTSIEAKPVP